MSENKKWIEIIIKSNNIFEDILYSVLYNFNITTFEIIDYNTLLNFKNIKPDWVILDEDLMEKNDYIIIKIYLNEEDYSIKEIDEIKRAINAISNSIEIINNKIIEDTDWSKEWKKFYKPFKIGKNIVVKPSWEEFINTDNNLVIDIDPGMAFGTGTHETTSLCIEVLEELNLSDELVYDVGTGSGILAIAAAKLGAKKVVAIDIDPISVKATIENVKLNNTENIVSVYEGNLLDSVSIKGDIIIANILPNIIIELIPDVRKVINASGYFISSGILIEKLDKVKNQLINYNFKIIEIKEKGDWVCILSQIENE